MNEYDIYQWAVMRFGAHHQINKAAEELGELIQALIRYGNGEPVIGNVCEEIADVEIMLEQLKIILGERYEKYLEAKKAEKIGKLARYLTLADPLEEPNEPPAD